MGYRDRAAVLFISVCSAQRTKVYKACAVYVVCLCAYFFLVGAPLKLPRNIEIQGFSIHDLLKSVGAKRSIQARLGSWIQGIGFCRGIRGRKLYSIKKYFPTQ